MVPRQHLSEQEKSDMLLLMQAYFDNVIPERFHMDLQEKDWVLLLQDTDRRVAGFSSQQLVSLPQGDGTKFLFSGDTIIHHRHRNQPGLAGAFGHLMLRLVMEYPNDELFWFLISKGPRTYRFLPVFFHDFHPAALHPEDVKHKSRLDTVASWKFGSNYDSRTGIVRLPGNTDRLKPEGQALAPTPDPHVRFFLSANPGWRQGDELACIAPIREDNLNKYARRVIRAVVPVWEF